MKKILSVVLVLCMLLLAVPMSVSATTTLTKDEYITQMGYKTNAAWIPVDSAEDLEAISNTENKNYYLTTDITITGDMTDPLVGDRENVGFVGVLDGCGFTVTLNGTYNAGAKSLGFFCNDFGGTLKNITFGSANAPITFKGAHANYGIIANQVAKKGTIENVTVYGDMDITRDGATNVGLFVGKTNGNGDITFKNCTAIGTIKVPSSGKQLRKIGGFIGANENKVALENCVSDFKLDYTGQELTEESSFGGFVGYNKEATDTISVTSCINYSDLPTATNVNVGGIVGKGSLGIVTLTKCVNFGNVGENGIVGGGEGIKLTVEKCVSVSAYDLQMINGASVKFDAPTALRFGTVLGKNLDVAVLKELFGEENVKLGTLIATTATVEAAQAFTKKDLTDGTYTDVAAEISNGIFVAKTGDLAASDYKTAYSAVAYVSVKVDGEWITVYSEYSAQNNSRTVEAVAKLASEDLSDTQTGEYVNASGDKFSPYTAEQLGKLKNYYEVAN